MKCEAPTGICALVRAHCKYKQPFGFLSFQLVASFRRHPRNLDTKLCHGTIKKANVI